MPVVVNATEFKQRFGTYVEHAQKEPVEITRSGRLSAVLLSADEFRRMREHEDKYWAMLAAEAKRGGFAGTEESAEWLAEGMRRCDRHEEA